MNKPKRRKTPARSRVKLGWRKKLKAQILFNIEAQRRLNEETGA